MSEVSPGAAAADDFYKEMPPLETEETPPVESQTDDTQKVAEATETPSETEEEVIGTFEELLQHFELDSEYVEGLEVTRRVRGEEKTYKLGEILNESEKYDGGDNYLAEAKAKSKAILADAEQKQNAIGENLVVSSKLIEQLESKLNEDRKNINWAELREKDPAEYSALKDEMREREADLNSIKEQAQDTYRAALAQSQEQQDAALKERLPQEREVLFEKLPDWGEDADKAESEARDVVNFLQAEGYSENEVKFVTHNGRDLSLAVKAMRYDRIRDKASAEEKRVRKVPRILKPGADKGGDSNANEPAKDRVDILYG